MELIMQRHVRPSLRLSARGSTEGLSYWDAGPAACPGLALPRDVWAPDGRVAFRAALLLTRSSPQRLSLVPADSLAALGSCHTQQESEDSPLWPSTHMQQSMQKVAGWERSEALGQQTGKEAHEKGRGSVRRCPWATRENCLRER